ncbi:hypothetical protein C8R46DRAFT_1184256 [Mycena filopes]|nr:hypothetical protein C8R46DRAFT_1184256 [Mycena filopes]
MKTTLALLLLPTICAGIIIDFNAQAALRAGDRLNCPPPNTPSTPLYRLVNPDTELYAYQFSHPRPAFEGFEFDGAVARVYATRQRATVPLFHLFKPATHDSVFMRSPPSASSSRRRHNEPEEEDKNENEHEHEHESNDDAEDEQEAWMRWHDRGYVARGVAAYIFPRRVCGAVPLFALTKSESEGEEGGHLYTTDAGERDDAVANEGYTAAGIVGYVVKA